MQKNEILIVHGTDYIAMTRQLLKNARLDEQIQEKQIKEEQIKEQQIKEKQVKEQQTKEAQISDKQVSAGNKKTALRIGIKPNLVAPVLAEDGGTTHPEVVEGLIQYLKEHGYENLVILESSWVGDRTEEAFEVCGYYELARKYQVELLDMKKAEAVEVDCAGLNLKVCRPALELDFLINVPVLKGHCQTRITCALKNMKGLLPDSQKRAFHRMGLHEPIGHLSAGIKQDFILVDSICGDLSFEDGGNPVQQGRLIAAADPVLCDTYCCSLLNILPEEVPYIGYAAQCGCGSSNLSDSQVTELNPPIYDIDYSLVGKALELSEAVEEVESCSACYGYLIPALNQLKVEGLYEKLNAKICIGQGYRGKKEGEEAGKKAGEEAGKEAGEKAGKEAGEQKNPACTNSGDGGRRLGIGNCTRGFACHLPGCPPTEQEIYEFIKSHLAETCQ
ncbi:MAG: DUF362 domain-containing protein [Lachnospiraceae bacterium]|nr:DUF362 domain-containing protein [Lachnospiraceae bacterium]